MKVQVLGMGCAKCRKMVDNVETAVRELGRPIEVEKVSDVNEIVKYGVIVTPALVVDGEVKAVGKVPSVREIKALLG